MATTICLTSEPLGLGAFSQPIYTVRAPGRPPEPKLEHEPMTLTLTQSLVSCSRCFLLSTATAGFLTLTLSLLLLTLALAYLTPLTSLDIP